MIRNDGCSEIHPEKSSISLIQVGRLDPELFTKIHSGLQTYVNFVLGTGERPFITIGFLNAPVFPVKEYPQWQTEYSSLLSHANFGPVTIAITAQGFWETQPISRYIFCSVVRPGTVAISLHRFQHMDTNRFARTQKEVIKGLGMALGLGHCSDRSCIQSLHWRDEDFDQNTGVCESCGTKIRVRLQQCFDDKTCMDTEN
jgi:hypothetical protein